MQVDVAAATVVGREMEDDARPFDRTLAGPRAAEVVFDELDRCSLDVLLDVFEPSAAQIVDDADVRAARDELVDERGADERGAACDERGPAGPVEGARHECGA